MLQNGGKGNWYFAEAVFRGSKGMFRAPARPTFAPGGKSLLRFPKFLRCLTAVGTFSFLSPTAHFSQQLEKWAKEPEETKGFFTSSARYAVGKGESPCHTFTQIFLSRSVKGLSQQQRR